MKSHDKKLYAALAIPAILFIACAVSVFTGHFAKWPFILGNTLALITTIVLFYATLNLQKTPQTQNPALPATNAEPINAEENLPSKELLEQNNTEKSETAH